MGERIKAYLASAIAFFKGLSGQVKATIILIASALLVIKFRDLLIDLLVSSSKRLLKDSEQKDAKLSAQENAANTAANALIDDANKLAQEKPVVDDDWNKK